MACIRLQNHIHIHIRTYEKTNQHQCAQVQKKSISTSRLVTGNSHCGGGPNSQLFKQKYKDKEEIPGRRVQTKCSNNMLAGGKDTMYDYFLEPHK